jgi:hypothetical protein
MVTFLIYCFHIETTKNFELQTFPLVKCYIKLFYAYYLTPVKFYNSIALVINGALVGDTKRRKPQYWK